VVDDRVPVEEFQPAAGVGHHVECGDVGRPDS
jgi:hypothetical protein